ncbi:hypothetical protein C8J56DRAFT_1054408 [Mycena floridula]|nr:hypothetical protein C8J56DRAFT_1054408 [Mycena floridula]
MAEKKQAANKVAMSRALGAAFLNHQVEQLEKTVERNGPASGNWRDRKAGGSPPNQAKRNIGTTPTTNKAINRKKAGEIQIATKDMATPQNRNQRERYSPADSHTRRRSNDNRGEKDADVIVVDASVLINGLDHLRKWCRDGREEVIIVPLEALNTLDLLKKGTTALARAARAASRVLEEQVGTNPRIRVQQDDAFVLWDQIAFAAANSDPEDKSSPEWVRRTICCARWELEQVKPSTDGEKGKSSPKVLLALCTSGGNLSPQGNALKLSDIDSLLTPVPLPAPSHVHANKHEPRSTGSLVAHWASRAAIPLLDVKPTSAGGPPYVHHPRSSSEDERIKRTIKGRRPPQNPSEGGKGLVERSPAVLAMMEMVSQPSKVVRVLARGEKLDPDP